MLYPTGKIDTEYIIPNTVTSIESDAFYYCSNLTSVTILNGVTSIRGMAFFYCTSLTSLIIGNSVTSIESQAFNGCNNLNSIIINATTPPTLGGNVFGTVLNTIPVYIPCGTYNNYNTAPGWDYFSNFIELTDCGTTISGKIKRQNQTTLNSGLVSLYRLQTLSQYTLIDAAPIENDGSYLFTNVELSSYFIKAVPTSSENALPTYYGNTIVWNQAAIVTVGNNSLQNMDITIILQTPLGGGSVISGYVGESNSGKSLSKAAVENPVENVNVYLQALQSSEWTTIAVTYTNEEGYFEFTQVPTETYRIIIDIPGLANINPRTIEITEDGTTIDDIELTITEEGIITAGETSITTIYSNNNIRIYPNPTKEKFVIDYDRVAEIKLYDILGKEVLTQNINGKTEINIINLPNGIYSINIISNGQVVGNSKIVKQ